MAVQAVSAPLRLDVTGLVKDSAMGALMAALLALPLIGLETTDSGGGALTIRPHFDWVAYAAVAVFTARLVIGWWSANRRTVPREDKQSLVTKAAAWTSRNSVIIGIAGVVFAVVLPFLPFSSGYVVDTATSVLIYVMLGWGLNVVVGLAGLLDLGYVAFYAVGAYSFALLSSSLGFGFWQALPLAGLFAALTGIILGFPVLRLRGDYLAIVTLGFGEIIRLVLLNWSDVTGGPNGISGIPRPTFFGMPFARNAPEGVTTFNQFFSAHFFELDYASEHRTWFLYFVILALALITNMFTVRIRKLPVGRAWEALREDEVACRALGINATNVKLSAFAIGAMFGGFAGCFFGARQGFISPESFNFMQSATILAIVVLGGMGSQVGVVLAAIVLITLPEVGRQFGDLRMLLFGAAMVGIMIWRPRGLLAWREPTIRINGRAAAGP